MKSGPTNSTVPSTVIASGLALALAACPAGTLAAAWKNNGPSRDWNKGANWNAGVVPNNAGAFIALYGHAQEEHAANNL